MLGIIIAFMAGGFVGIIVMCCCVAAARADRESEKELNNKADIS